MDSKPEQIHAHPQSRDTHTDTSVHGNSAPVNRADASVSDHGSKTMSIIALIFGVSGTVLALVLLIFLYGLWNRQTLLQIYYDDIKKELIARGMNPHPHMPSEAP